MDGTLVLKRKECMLSPPVMSAKKVERLKKRGSVQRCQVLQQGQVRSRLSIESRISQSGNLCQSSLQRVDGEEA